MQPLVSVIIPTYNAASYIRQTVESALNQTYRNIELIIMNDGSKDNSEEIILQLQKEDSRIRYQYKPNSGVSDTRNKGIALANGEYLAFLDADDLWKPDNLEKKITAMQQTHKKWVFSNLEYIDEANKPITVTLNNFRPYDIMDNLLLFEGDVVPGPCSNIVGTRELFGDDIRFDTRISSPADRDICLQLAAKDEPYFLDEKLWLYRLHSNSMTSVNHKVVDEVIYLYKKADEKNWFSSPGLRRKALSNVNLILAGICYHFPQQRKRMFGFLMRSFFYSPVNVVRKKIIPIFTRSKKSKPINHMRVLITGGAGFVPSSLADALLKREDTELVLVDNFLTGRKENIPEHPRCRFIKNDVNSYNDIAPVFLAFRFDYVFHYAAVVGVKRTLENPVMVLDDIQGIRNVLDLSKNTGVKRVFFSSSSEVYGEPVHLPQHEQTTPLNSRLPYAVVKNVGESFCRSYQQEYDLNFTLFRFFNTYGPKQSPDFVVSRFINAALENKDITVYGDGSQTRTFCYIDDNTEACINALVHNLFVNDVVNVGNDKAITVLELAETIIKLTKSRSKIIHLPPLPEGDMTRRQPDIGNMNQLLKREFISLEDGLSRIISSRVKQAH